MKTNITLSTAVLTAILTLVGNATAQSPANFNGRWASPGNGVLTIYQSGSSISATMSGNDGEWWGPRKNKGGTLTGTVNGRTAQFTAYDGVGNQSTLTVTLASDARSFNGTYRVVAGPIKGVSGSWSATLIQPPAQNIVWREVESGIAGTFNGTWTWNPNTRQFTGRWNNGAQAVITIVSDDGVNIVLRRSDPAGASAGMTADYVGVLNGNSIRGTMTLYYRGGSSKGTWSAQW